MGPEEMCSVRKCSMYLGPGSLRVTGTRTDGTEVQIRLCPTHVEEINTNPALEIEV